MTQNIEATRSSITMPLGSFTRALGLVGQVPWLQARSEALTQLCAVLETDSEFGLTFDLLRRAKYFGEESFSVTSELVAHHIHDVWKLSAADTCCVSQDGAERSNSADVALQTIRNKLDALDVGWSGSNFPGRLRIAATGERWKNVVLVEDFVGTGKKMLGKIAWVRQQKAQPRRIFAVSLVSHEPGIQAVSAACEGAYAAEPLQRGISDYYGKAASQKIDTMKAIEGRFQTIGAHESLGQDQCESLYFPVNINIPNNVFPVFWKKKHKGNPNFKPLFNRNSKS